MAHRHHIGRLCKFQLRDDAHRPWGSHFNRAAAVRNQRAVRPDTEIVITELERIGLRYAELERY